MEAARRQREAVATIEKVGGVVDYDWEYDEGRTTFLANAHPPGPPWLRGLLGDEFFTQFDVGVLVHLSRAGAQFQTIDDFAAHLLQGLLPRSSSDFDGSQRGADVLHFPFAVAKLGYGARELHG